MGVFKNQGHLISTPKILGSSIQGPQNVGPQVNRNSHVKILRKKAQAQADLLVTRLGGVVAEELGHLAPANSELWDIVVSKNQGALEL